MSKMCFPLPHKPTHQAANLIKILISDWTKHQKWFKRLLSMDTEIKTPQINFDKMWVFLIKTNIKYQHVHKAHRDKVAHMAAKK